MRKFDVSIQGAFDHHQQVEADTYAQAKNKAYRLFKSRFDMSCIVVRDITTKEVKETEE